MNRPARRTAALFLSAALLPALALVTARFHSATTSGAKARDGKRPRIALVIDRPSNYWKMARVGAEQAAREEGIELIVKAPTSGTIQAQSRIVDGLLAQGVEGIAISPIDQDKQGFALLTKVAAKTLLFEINSHAPQSKMAQIVERDDGSMFTRHPMNYIFVSGDDIRDGQRAAQEIKRALPGGGDIMLFDTRRSPAAFGRLSGLERALKGSNVRILGERDDGTKRSRAKSNVTQALQQHPKLAACVGLLSYNGPAILSAVREAGKLGQVKIIAFDDEEATLHGVQDGSISATIVQQPALFGAETVHTMAQVLAGQHHDMAEPKKIVVPSLIITRGNVGPHRAFLQKMLAR